MAIYHLSVKSGSPGMGKPHATYIQREGKYADRDDLRATESGNMPAWSAHDPTLFWSKADDYERANGRVYRELEIALPRELDRGQQVELAREFTSNTLGQRHAYTWGIHSPSAGDGGEQPHLHLMFSERRIDGVDRDPEHYFRRFNPKAPERGGAGKDRYFNSQKFLWDIRAEWAATANEHLERAGLEVRIDHRSYRAQGIELEPQLKIGIAGHASDRFVLEEVTHENRERSARNGERLALRPEIAIETLTEHQSMFSRQDLQNLVFRNSDSTEQFQTLFHKVLQSPELVALDKGKGEPEWFTSKTLFEAEKALVATAGGLASRSQKRLVPTSIRQQIEASRSFNAGQSEAYQAMTGAAALAVVNGAAGSGKSYVLASVRETYERAGFMVVGATLQGKTAEDLERDAGIRSSTLHSFLRRLERGEARLDDRTVVVVDEAGLIGSAQYGQLLKRVEEARATLRLVGDAYQLHAVAAGDAFRAVSQQAASAGSSAALTEIVRQRHDWQRHASIALSQHRIGEGLEAYSSRGFVTEFANQEQARAGLLAQWDADRKEHPKATQIIVTHTNRERNALNDSVRAIRRSSGELGLDSTIQTATGRIDLARGDRLVFLRNDDGLAVKNGTLGTVTSIKGHELMVQVDGRAKPLRVNTKDYRDIDLGYALTVHKSQGATVDRAYLMATDSLEARLSYVSLTRHREAVHVAYSREHFADYADLSVRLSRVAKKAFTADLGILNFNRSAETGQRDKLAERREKVAPLIPPNATAREVFLAKLEAMTLDEIGDQVVRLRQSKEMQSPERHPDMVQAIARRQAIEWRRSVLTASIGKAADKAKEHREMYRLLDRLHRFKVLSDPDLAKQEQIQAEGRKAIEELEKPLAVEQANVTVVFARVKAEIAKLRPITEAWIKAAEQIQNRKMGEEKLRSALDNAVSARREARAGFRDGDAAWRALPDKTRRLIDQIVKAPVKERMGLLNAQGLEELRQLKIADIYSKQRERGAGL